MNVPVEPNSTPGHLKENLKCAQTVHSQFSKFAGSPDHPAFAGYIIGFSKVIDLLMII